GPKSSRSRQDCAARSASRRLAADGAPPAGGAWERAERTVGAAESAALGPGVTGAVTAPHGARAWAPPLGRVENAERSYAPLSAPIPARRKSSLSVSSSA